jgi:2-dehydropantoate 2-reductase
MKIRLIGSGSLGMLFAGRFAGIGAADIELIARSKEQAREIAGHGLQVIQQDGEALLTWPRSAWMDTDLEESSPDWIFLMVKQQHITEPLALRVAKQLELAPRARLICFQNGIGHTELLSRYIPKKRIYMAITTEGAKRTSPNTVEHTGTGVTWVGSAFEQTNEPAIEVQDEDNRLAPFIDFMNQAGFKTYASKSMGIIQWNKLLINAVINPLTAILRIPNGELLMNPYAFGLMKSLYAEGRQIALAKGTAVADDLWDQILMVCRNTARNHSSMLQDIMAGRRTEVDRINGSLVAYADELGLEVPVQKCIYALIKAMEG